VPASIKLKIKKRTKTLLLLIIQIQQHLLRPAFVAVTNESCCFKKLAHLFNEDFAFFCY